MGDVRPDVITFMENGKYLRGYNSSQKIEKVGTVLESDNSISSINIIDDDIYYTDSLGAYYKNDGTKLK